MRVGWVWWGGLSARVRAWLDRVTWVAARGAVDAVRYQPRHLDVVVACGRSQPEVSPAEVAGRHRAVGSQYTASALPALFHPELARVDGPALLARLVNETSPALHAGFDVLYAGWRSEWRESGRRVVDIGLGAGLSFGLATIGFIGPSGKKQFGVIGEPVNLAAFLGSE